VCARACECTAARLSARACMHPSTQAVAMRDGRLAEQEVTMAQRADANALREREQQCQLELLANKFDAMRASCEQQVRVS